VSTALTRHGRTLDRWSRGRTLLHRTPAHWKLILTLAALIAISLERDPRVTATLAAAALAFFIAARLPVLAVLARAALVLPFAAIFAVVLVWQGEWPRALLLSARAFASALWVLVLAGTTPVEKILGVLRRAGLPELLVEVIHFLWRYLQVVGEQAARLQRAARARSAQNLFGIAATMVAVLFASSYSRAQRIHRAMMARGATGSLP
jgi:cobalt/nickel transport system permease protein